MTTEQISEKVKNIVANGLNRPIEEVDLKSSFKQLGADSLDAVELILEFEKSFGIAIPDTEAEKVTTVEEAITCIQNALKAKNA